MATIIRVARVRPAKNPAAIAAWEDEDPPVQTDSDDETPEVDTEEAAFELSEREAARLKRIQGEAAERKRKDSAQQANREAASAREAAANERNQRVRAAAIESMNVVRGSLLDGYLMRESGSQVNVFRHSAELTGHDPLHAAGKIDRPRWEPGMLAAIAPLPEAVYKATKCRWMARILVEHGKALTEYLPDAAIRMNSVKESSSF